MVALGATLWGCWSLFLRPAGLSGIQCAFLSMALMALPAPFVLRPQAFRDRRATLALGILGLSDAANCALFFAAVQRGPVAVAVLTHYLAPLLIALAAPWVLRERRSTRALLAAPLTLAGLALLLGTPRGGFSDPWTALLGGGSALFYMANVLASKEASRAYSPLAVSALHAPIAALALLLVFGRGALPPTLDSHVLLAAAGCVLCGLFANMLFLAGLRGIPTTAAGALTYLEPLTAALVGQLVFGEALGPLGVLGGLAVLLTGVWVASEPRAGAQPVPAPTSTG
ncbi:EamA family transporter [Vitiosangium sp. GDMCC 1.1324]|uniref:EamA family transporter n=1 Tax=Vitiosangium sp. (strain GDMCC 1.1324) TaxID=2138576 RepID=UPI000D3A61A9|nr:DMT family transporter [Vitiosangium sp. GDMCC 1.1324]PTL82659.1 EamA family transporter [Vitiosangium sp. GDMCC 1.1324]